jgi:hypothetical protein
MRYPVGRASLSRPAVSGAKYQWTIRSGSVPLLTGDSVGVAVRRCNGTAEGDGEYRYSALSTGSKSVQLVADVHLGEMFAELMR